VPNRQRDARGDIDCNRSMSLNTLDKRTATPGASANVVWFLGDDDAELGRPRS